MIGDINAALAQLWKVESRFPPFVTGIVLYVSQEHLLLIEVESLYSFSSYKFPFSLENKLILLGVTHMGLCLRSAHQHYPIFLASDEFMDRQIHKFSKLSATGGSSA